MLITNETEAQYHAAVDRDGFPAIGSTKLKTFIYDSPKHFQETHILGLRETGESDAARFGKHVHAFALEGRFDVKDHYAVIPGTMLKSNGALNPTNSDYQGWMADTHKQGLTPIKQQDLDILEKRVSRLGKFLRGHETFAAITSRGEPEVGFRHEREDGLTVQAKMDHLNGLGLDKPLRTMANGRMYEYDLGRPYFADLKVTELSIEDWDRKWNRDMHYGSQAGHYQQTLLKETGDLYLPLYMTLHTEKNERVDPRFQLHYFPNAVLEKERAINEDGLRRMAICKETQIYPDGTGGIKILDPGRRQGAIAEDLSI